MQQCLKQRATCLGIPAQSSLSARRIRPFPHSRASASLACGAQLTRTTAECSEQRPALSSSSLLTSVAGACVACLLLTPAQALAAGLSSTGGPVFEPHLDTSILYPQLIVLALTGGAAAYWWLVVVPSARASLAKDKRKGEVREYLGELESDPSRRVERWFYDDWLRQLKARRSLNAWGAAPAASTSVADAGAAAGSRGAAPPAASSQPGAAAPGGAVEEEQNLFKPSAPTPEPRFWSLDNPVVATGAAMLVLAAVATALHGGP